MALDDYEHWYQTDRQRKTQFAKKLLELCKEYDLAILYEHTPRVEKGTEDLYKRMEQQFQWWDQ